MRKLLIAAASMAAALTLTLTGGVGAAVIIGALAGLSPARRAARLTPTEALAVV